MILENVANFTFSRGPFPAGLWLIEQTAPAGNINILPARHEQGTSAALQWTIDDCGTVDIRESARSRLQRLHL